MSADKATTGRNGERVGSGVASEDRPGNPADESLGPPVFREFLYADLDRARSLIAQLVGGVPEEDRGTTGRSRRFTIGAQNYFGYNAERRSEEYQQRSLLDALFPELEGVLEAEGWLTDVSDIVHSQQIRDAGRLQDAIRPASIVRITADAQLFDAEYIAQVLSGTSVAIDGIARAASSGEPPAISTSKKHTDRRPRPKQGAEFADTGKLEDLVEHFDELFPGLSPDLFRAIIRVCRGMFGKGLHMLVSTRGPVGWTATARLQQGRRYLDAEPDVLFSRYGLTSQEWTIVGTIGHYSQAVDHNALDDVDFMNPDGKTVSRPRFASGISALMSLVAGSGFADTPPHPGFSIVPMAVYRMIPAST